MSGTELVALVTEVVMAVMALAVRVLAVRLIEVRVVAVAELVVEELPAPVSTQRYGGSLVDFPPATRTGGCPRSKGRVPRGAYQSGLPNGSSSRLRFLGVSGSHSSSP